MSMQMGHVVPLPSTSEGSPPTAPWSQTVSSGGKALSLRERRHVLGGRVGVSETACGRGGCLDPSPYPLPWTWTGGPRVVGASKMAQHGSKSTSESPR